MPTTSTTNTTFAPFTVATESEPRSMSIAQARAAIENQVGLAHRQALMLRSAHSITQVDGDEAWWNLYAIGPFQFDESRTSWQPRQVIKAGEPAFIATIMVLNDMLTLSSGITAADMLSSFRLPYEIRCQTGNLSVCTPGPASLNGVRCGGDFKLVPGLNFYVDVMEFSTSLPGLYEMNISAHILGATRPLVNAPQFAGYARIINGLTPNLFLDPVPGPQYDLPMQFLVWNTNTACS